VREPLGSLGSSVIARRSLALLLLAGMVVLVSLAYASPRDPLWQPGIYDDADFDDVVIELVTLTAIPVPPLVLSRMQCGGPPSRSTSLGLSPVASFCSTHSRVGPRPTANPLPLGPSRGLLREASGRDRFAPEGASARRQGRSL